MIRDETTYKPPTRLFDPINPEGRPPVKPNKTTLSETYPITTDSGVTWDPRVNPVVKPVFKPDMYSPVENPVINPIIDYKSLPFSPTPQPIKDAYSVIGRDPRNYTGQGVLKPGLLNQNTNRYQNLNGNPRNSIANMARNIQPQTNNLTMIISLMRRLGII